MSRQWHEMIGERFGHNGCRSVMKRIEDPEKAGIFDLVEVGIDDVLHSPRPAYVSRNAGGMDRRDYAIANEEFSAESRIRASFGRARWFRGKRRGTYHENGRGYGLVVGVVVALRSISDDR